MLTEKPFKRIPAVLLSAVLVSAATAQEPDQAGEVQGDDAAVPEILVSDRYLSLEKVNSVKTPTPIINVPQSVSIITQPEIQAQGIKDLRNIVDYTVGVNTSQGEGHRDSVVFRGVRSTADFYVDGVRDDVQYYRPLYNVEQVEILRGPNALLFGRGGTGGVLNRVMKKGEIGETFTGYNASVDTYGEHDLAIDTNYAIGDSAAFRLNAYYAGLNNHRDFYDGDRVGLNPTARFELGPATTIDLAYEYINHERFVDRGIPTGSNGKPVRAFDDIVFGDPEMNETDLEAHVFRATLQHEFLENLKGNFNVSWGDYDKVYENFYASGYDQRNTPGVVTLDGYIDSTDRQNLVFSTNLVGEFETGSIRHTVLLGGEYIDTSSDQDRFNAFWNTTADDNEVFAITDPLNLRGGVGINAAGVRTSNSYTTDLNDDTRVDIEVYSVYLQNQIEVTDWLQLVGGGRFDSFEIDVFNVPANERRNRTDDQVSPRGGVILKPMENISVYGSYSESFLPRSGEQFDNIDGGADDLDPDTFETMEGGIKWDIVPTMSFTAAYFRNEQTRTERDNTTGENFEVRGLEVEGLEVQLQGQLFERAYIRTGYTWMDGETAAGADPREIPDNMFFFWGTYEVSERLGVGLGVTHQASSLINDGGSEKLPGYTRVDAMAYYDITSRIRAQVNIENLTDETYFPNAHSTHQATVGQPIHALFSLIGTF